MTNVIFANNWSLHSRRKEAEAVEEGRKPNEKKKKNEEKKNWKGKENVKHWKHEKRLEKRKYWENIFSSHTHRKTYKN